MQLRRLISVFAAPLALGASMAFYRSSTVANFNYYEDSGGLQTVSPGEHVASLGKSYDGKRVPSQGCALLLVVGNCTSCASKSIDFSRVLDSVKHPPVLVYWSFYRDLDQSTKSFMKRAYVFCDPKMRLLPQAFNAGAPRAYSLDLRRNLISDVEKPDESVPDFIRRCNL